jgi:hypothetical protein
MMIPSIGLIHWWGQSPHELIKSYSPSAGSPAFNTRAFRGDFIFKL